MPNRFVILHHRVGGSEHWDLMLEHGGVLLTWQLFTEPVDASCLPMKAKRIGNHRKAYLDYEGPISNDRGYVQRVDSGVMHLKEFTDRQVSVELEGQRLTGWFTLTLVNGEDWVLESRPVRSPDAP